MNIAIASSLLAAFTLQFGDPIPGSGEDPSKPDCGMVSASVFDKCPEGLERVGSVELVDSSKMPETAFASIGFEGLDRKLFDPDRTYDALAKCGVKHARVQTMWSRCETEKGVYDFSALDDIVDNLLRRGIRPWFSVGFGNVLYMTNCYTTAAVGCMPLYYGDECRNAWCAYVTALARRYRGKVTHWEIWNEPDLTHFWQPKKPNAADYVKLLKVTGDIIRKEVPGAKIGGVCAVVFNSWGKSVLEGGGAELIDFWCVHGYNVTPEEARGDQRSVDGKPLDYCGQIDALKKLAESKAGREIEIWQGESGFPSWFPESHWLFPQGDVKQGWQSQANQAKWMLRRFVTDIRAGMAISSFYQAADISRHYSMAHTTNKHPAEHGILNGWTFKPKMSYYAMGHFNAVLSGAKFVSTRREQGAIIDELGRAGQKVIVYYAPHNYGEDYQGRPFKAKKIKLAVPEGTILVDLLRGGKYLVKGAELPLVDYPLALLLPTAGK